MSVIKPLKPGPARKSLNKAYFDYYAEHIDGSGWARGWVETALMAVAIEVDSLRAELEATKRKTKKVSKK